MSNHGVEITTAMYNACLDTFSNAGGVSKRSSDIKSLSTRALLIQLDVVSSLEDINRIKQVLISRGDFDKGPAVVRIINAIVRGGERVHLALFARNPRFGIIVERDALAKEALFCAFLKTGLSRQAKELAENGSGIKIRRVYKSLVESTGINVPAKIDMVYALMGEEPRRSDALYYCMLFRDFGHVRGLNTYAGQKVSDKVRVVLIQGYIRAREWSFAAREMEKLVDVGGCIEVLVREVKRRVDVERVLGLVPFTRVVDGDIDDVLRSIRSGVVGCGVDGRIGDAYVRVYRELLEAVRDGFDVDKSLQLQENEYRSKSIA
jgi:hypothetical protein